MKPSRRQFLKSASVASIAALAGSPVGARSSEAQSGAGPRVRMVETPILDIGYEEHGDSEGFPIILLHGFPYDVRSWDGVAPPLADAGYRVLVPYLRGYGLTRFRDSDVLRTAEQAAIAQDVIDFADALSLEQWRTGGFRLGESCGLHRGDPAPRTGEGPGGHRWVFSTEHGDPWRRPAPAVAEARRWYQWYFNTDQGRAGLEANRRDIIRYLWETWSPGWEYTDEAFNRSAPSFDNPDFVDVVIHSYRHRHLNAPGEKRFLAVERRLAERPPIQVPAIVLRAAEGGFGRPSQDPSGDEARFPGLVARRIIEKAGHNLPVQRPDAVSAALFKLL